MESLKKELNMVTLQSESDLLGLLPVHCMTREAAQVRFCHPFIMFFFLLFICAYNVWVISPPFLSSSPSLPGRNYFALISNFVEERV
jgi:hypothetical protein